MSRKMDLVATFPGISIIHQKIPGHEVGRHMHDEHEFFMPLQGEVTVEFNGKVIKAGPGRILYVPPNLDHSFSSTSQGSGERVIWLIDHHLWKRHIKESFQAVAIPGHSLAKEILFYLLLHQKAAGSRYFIAALIEALGGSIASAQLQESRVYIDHIHGKIGDVRLQKAFEFLESAEAEPSVSEWAHSSGLSQRNFNRLFMQETGLTPKDYMILRRIEKAKTLLKTSRMTVTDIALEVGYNSLSKFIETFRRVEGCLPSDYRNV